MTICTPLLYLISNSVSDIYEWAHQNHIRHGAWKTILVPEQLAQAPSGAPYVLLGAWADNPDRLSRFRVVLIDRRMVAVEVTPEGLGQWTV